MSRHEHLQEYTDNPYVGIPFTDQANNVALASTMIDFAVEVYKNVNWLKRKINSQQINNDKFIRELDNTLNKILDNLSISIEDLVTSPEATIVGRSPDMHTFKEKLGELTHLHMGHFRRGVGDVMTNTGEFDRQFKLYLRKVFDQILRDFGDHLRIDVESIQGIIAKRTAQLLGEQGRPTLTLVDNS